eukprot:Opistho-2@58002
MSSDIKTIYVSINGKPETVEFCVKDGGEAISDAFRSAAEAAPDAILKLRNVTGAIVGFSPNITENTPDSRYTLEVVADSSISDAGAPKKVGQLLRSYNFTTSDVEDKLERIEKKLRKTGHTGATAEVASLKNELDRIRDKLEGLEHLSWLGLFKKYPSTPVRPKTGTRKSRKDCEAIYEKFRNFDGIRISAEAREYLRNPTFNNWQWDDSEMLFLLQLMFEELGLIEKFKIEVETLKNFLVRVHQNYNNNPFHNFKHCFCVSQMMYGLISLTHLYEHMPDYEILVLLFSAVCHDLDHPGLNNAYQINARTELAIRYNDASPLENHHCSVAFQLISEPSANIFENLDKDMYNKIRAGTIKCILATDMARHGDILKTFKGHLEVGFDYANADHRAGLMQILIKCADISNEVRPTTVSEQWVDCLLEEFFAQSDLEKLEGLPVAPFMDRDKVTKPGAQIGFIGFVLIPLFETIARMFPQLDEPILQSVKRAHKYYQDMGARLEEEKKKAQEAKVEA